LAAAEMQTVLKEQPAEKEDARRQRPLISSIFVKIQLSPSTNVKVISQTGAKAKSEEFIFPCRRRYPIFSNKTALLAQCVLIKRPCDDEALFYFQPGEATKLISDR
jgi:hypothetical protein